MGQGSTERDEITAWGLLNILPATYEWDPSIYEDQQTQRLSSALYVCLSFVCDEDIYRFRSWFFVFLIFLFLPLPPTHGPGLPPVDFSPWDKSQHLQVFESPPSVYFSPLSSPQSPLSIL